jgi:hypothetical protein
VWKSRGENSHGSIPPTITAYVASNHTPVVRGAVVIASFSVRPSTSRLCPCRLVLISKSSFVPRYSEKARRVSEPKEESDGDRQRRALAGIADARAA